MLYNVETELTSEKEKLKRGYRNFGNAVDSAKSFDEVISKSLELLENTDGKRSILLMPPAGTSAQLSDEVIQEVINNNVKINIISYGHDYYKEQRYPNFNENLTRITEATGGEHIKIYSDESVVNIYSRIGIEDIDDTDTDGDGLLDGEEIITEIIKYVFWRNMMNTKKIIILALTTLFMAWICAFIIYINTPSGYVLVWAHNCYKPVWRYQGMILDKEEHMVKFYFQEDWFFEDDKNGKKISDDEILESVKNTYDKILKYINKRKRYDEYEVKVHFETMSQAEFISITSADKASEYVKVHAIMECFMDISLEKLTQLFPYVEELECNYFKERDYIKQLEKDLKQFKNIKKIKLYENFTEEEKKELEEEFPDCEFEWE